MILQLTYADLNEAIIEEHKLIVNTTPLGTFPKIDECPDIPYQFITPSIICMIWCIILLKHLFLAKRGGKGAAIKNGYEMLKYRQKKAGEYGMKNN